MGRVIKFRAWDVEDKRMIDIGESTGIEWSRTDGIKLIFGDDFHDDFVSGGIVHYELMQFTGLTDRNGKEIYEGDIVELEMHNATRKAQVIWTAYRWWFQLCEAESDGRIETIWVEAKWQERCTVIGHIYETPEQGV